MSADTVTPPPVTPSQAPTAASPAPAPVSRRKRWLKRLLPLTTLLVLGAWFAPAIVANTALRNHFARKALADVRGSVDVGGASLGWFSPVELNDVTIKDEAGRTVVSVPKITSQKSLLELARNQAEPGELTLEKPTIAVVCEKNTTNLETCFAEYLKDDGKSAAPTRTPVSVRITAGTLTLTDAETNKSASIDGIDATANIPASRAEPITVKLTAATGKLDADVSLGDAISAKVACSGLPLDAFAPLVKRADPNVKLAGAATADIQVKYANDALTITGSAGVKQLALSAPWLKGDTLALDSAELPLDIELAGRVLKVRKFALACDAGTLTAAGTFDPDEATEKLFTKTGVSVNANIDLATLAKKLPKLLRVQNGVELREGKLTVALTSTADGAGVVWEGAVGTSALKATRDGKPIAWEQPLHVDFNCRYEPGQLPTFKKLICTSDFIAVNAETTPETVRAAANIYLHRLGPRLAEFVDFGYSLTGEANVTLVGRRAPDGTFAAASGIELTNFALTDRTGHGLNEPKLKLQLSASGKVRANGPVELNKASVELTANGDALSVTLLEPVSDVKKLASGSVDVSVSGDLARWKSRAAAITKIPPYQMSGNFIATGRAKFAGETITVDRLTVGLKNIKFRGAGLNIDEPTLSAVGDLTFTRANSTAALTKVSLNSAPLSVKDGALTFEMARDLVVTGSGQAVVDLNKLGAVVRLYADARGPDALYGRGTGPLRFKYAGDVTTFAGTLDVTNFAYGPKEKPVWAEVGIRVEADGSYTESADSISLAVAKVDRPGFALDAKGSVSKITTTQDANLTGTLKYDWQKLTPLARDLIGGNFNATGTGTRAFAVNGQLSPLGAQTAAALPPPEPKGGPIALKAPGAPAPKPPAPPAGPGLFAAMNGDAALGWDSIKAYGFDVGAGDLKATMKKGVATVAPITATFCGGKVTLAPTLKLDTAPGEVLLAKGPLVERAKLTPQATAGALGYALPAIANAGQAEGELSATADECRVPLDDFTRANFKGTLLIHKATVGASPLLSEIAKLLGAKNTAMTLASEESVPVQVANGRVHHQNFAFRVSGTTLRTSGSVGFDQTLDLVVDVPIPKDMPALKNNPVLIKAVAGKIVKVPVKGTLSKPEIDAKGFEHAVIALARESAKDVGKDLLEKELNKLFPGMPAPKSGGGLPFPLPFGKQ